MRSNRRSGRVSLRRPLSLMLLSILPYVPSSPFYGQETGPLTIEERREVLSRLLELQAARERIAAQAEHIDRLGELSERERVLHAQELALQERLTEVAERERDAEQRRGEQLQDLLDLQSRGPGFGCVLKKIFTVGIARCG